MWVRRAPSSSRVAPVLLSQQSHKFKYREKGRETTGFLEGDPAPSRVQMGGARAQSERVCSLRVFLKKIFPIFVCLGKLRVECKGCHGNTFFFFNRLVTWDPRTFWEPLLNVPDGGALSASGMVRDSFSGELRGPGSVAFSLPSKNVPPNPGGHLLLQ